MVFRQMLESLILRRSQSRRRQRRHEQWNRSECLERRALLTGNVQVQLIGANVHVTGDGADNSVEIVAESSTVIVRGLSGTTINGAASVFTLSANSTSFTGGLNASLGAGHDSLKIGQGVSISGNVRIDGDGGNDSMGITGSTLGANLTVFGGDDSNTISLQNSSVAQSVFVFSTGAATINVSDSTIGGLLQVHTGSDSDCIVLDGATINGWTLFDTGRGDDDLVIRNSTINDHLSLFAGSGNDVAFFDAATVTGPAWLWMQRGNDSVQVQGASSFQKRLWHGGILGRDSIEIIPPAAISKLKKLGRIGSQVDDALIAARITDATTGAIAKAVAARSLFNASLTVVVAADTVVENAGTTATTMTVTRSGSTATALTVNLTSSNPSRATVPATVIIPAGSASATVNIAAIDNTTADPDAVITFTAASTGVNSGTDTLTVTSEEVAALTVTVVPGTVAENGGATAATFTVSRNTSDNSQPLTVNLLSGTTSRLTVGSSVVIPANASSVTFAGAVVENTVVDGDAVVTVSASATGFTGGQTTVTVTDNEAATLTVTRAPASIAEEAGAAAVTFTVTRNATNISQPLTVDLVSALPGRLIVPATVTIPANASSATFTGDPVSNGVLDGNASVNVTASAAGFTNGQATVTVTDDESPALSLSSLANTIGEAAGNNAVSYTLVRDALDLSQPLTVTLTSGTANRLTVPATVTVPAGQNSVTFFGSPVNNATFNGDAAVTVTATALGFGNADIVVTVIEDEAAPAPVLTVTTSVTTIMENAAPGTVQLTTTRLNGDNTLPLIVTVTLSSATRLSAPATVTIPAGQASVIVDLSTIDNTAVDGSTTVDIGVTATGFGPDQTDLTIMDNENATLTLTPQSSTVSEAVGTLPGTVFTDVTSSADILVNLEYSDSSILSGPASVVIPAGQPSVVVNFTVNRDSTVSGNVVAQIRATAIGAVEDVASVTISDADTFALTTDISANTTMQSNGTVITRNAAFNISGVTSPGATINIDSDADGQFDDGTTTAAGDGTYSFDVTLLHNAVNKGDNHILLKADQGAGSADAEVNAHLVIGSVVRFETNKGTWDAELLDAAAPGTVQNFRNYMNSTAWDNLIVHRSDPGFVIQGGGFTVSGGQIGAVPTNAPIPNEFNAANSNLWGTLSMAQLGGQPNSGTSQWFINTDDNANLDAALHTVFGRVIGDGMAVVEQINALTSRNLAVLYGISALGEVPLQNFNPPNTLLTGTVSTIAANAVVTGTGTLFTTELVVGQSISIGAKAFFVQSIQSNTSLTLTSAVVAPVTNITARKDVVPNDADFVVFSNIGEILAVI